MILETASSVLGIIGFIWMLVTVWVAFSGLRTDFEAAPAIHRDLERVLQRARASLSDLEPLCLNSNGLESTLREDFKRSIEEAHAECGKCASLLDGLRMPDGPPLYQWLKALTIALCTQSIAHQKAALLSITAALDRYVFVLRSRQHRFIEQRRALDHERSVSVTQAIDGGGLSRERSGLRARRPPSRIVHERNPHSVDDSIQHEQVFDLQELKLMNAFRGSRLFTASRFTSLG